MELFWVYWEKVKGYIQELKTLPARIRADELIVENILPKARLAGDTSTINKLEGVKSRLSKLLPETEGIKASIDKYLPEWLSFSQTQPNIGVIPIVLGVASIAALGVVAVKGLSLLKDYRVQKELLEGAKAGYWQAGEVARFEEAKQAALFNINMALPLLIIVGGVGVYMYYRRA